MHTRTFPNLPLSCLLLVFLFLDFDTFAQTVPTWQSARVTGSASQNNRYSYDAVVDATGNTYEVGDFRGTVVVGGTTLVTPTGTDSDGYIVKYTPMGTVAWIKQLSSTGGESVQSIALDAAGDIYIGGDFGSSFSLGNGVDLSGGSGTISKVFVARYSAQGTPIWAHQTSATGYGAVGGGDLGVDAAGNVYCTYFANIITVGSTTLTTLNNSKAIFLGRLSGSTGVLQSLVQAFSYAPPTPTAVYYRPTLAVVPTGEVYISTSFSHPAILGTTTLTCPNANTDVLVAKYGTQGTFEWVKHLSSAGIESAGNTVADGNGNLYVTFNFTDPIAVDGTILPSAGLFDGSLIKYSPQGTVQWVAPSGGPGADRLSSVALDAAGNPYVTGLFSNVTRFGATTLTSAGSQDISVAGYTSQGQLRWAQRAGGSGADAGSHIGLHANGEVQVLGYFAGTCNFGPFSLSTSTISETFLARLGSAPLATRTNQAVPASLYPNPAASTVHLPTVPVGSQVQLLDAVGRVAHTALVAPNATISVRGVVPGLYVVHAADAQGRQYTSRLVVE